MREGRASGTATVLFTDLVGSTDLLSRLGEAAYDEVRRAHVFGAPVVEAARLVAMAAPADLLENSL